MIEPWIDLFLQPRLEHAQCEDKRTDASGHKHRPIEARRDGGEPALPLNRALVLPFIGGHNVRGLTATQNAAQGHRETGKVIDFMPQKREPRLLGWTIAFCVRHRTALLP